MIRDRVVLVDRQDKEIGEMEKLEAHIQGVLHRAFSVFIFNQKGEMLIHQRAFHKYHGGGLWTNACCSHPQPGEDVHSAAMERLRFEMGLSCNLLPLFSFIYRSEVENNFIEHELDHVFIGYTDDSPQPNPDEVNAYKWITIDELKNDIQMSPSNYTVWFKEALPTVLAHK